VKTSACSAATAGAVKTYQRAKPSSSAHGLASPPRSLGVPSTRAGTATSIASSQRSPSARAPCANSNEKGRATQRTNVRA